jgi:uncharacterized repeat protein (TIGR03803 family)
MNPANGKSAWSGFFGPKRAEGRGATGVRQGRRQFRPAVSGLEGRQLLSASPMTTIASFNEGNATFIGGLAMDAKGDIYGTTNASGDYQGAAEGRIFEIAAGSKNITTLATFNGPNGYGMNGVALDAQGNLYGTTTGEATASNDGRVFELVKSTGKVITLATFNGTNGAFPNDVVVDGQGNVYGTTGIGGVHGVATVFEIPKGSNTAITLATFTAPGSAPKDLAVDGQGNLFGVDQGGGVKGAGSIFEIAKGSNTAATIAAFPNLDGSSISRLTLDAQGNVYGTTLDGGQFGDGTVFEIPAGSNNVTTLATFDGPNGSAPDPGAGVVMDAQGNLFGTTETGGYYGFGTVFEVPAGSNNVTTLNSFSGTNGTLISGVALEGQDTLVGTANGSGSGGGKVFEITLNTQPTVPVTSPPAQPATPVPASTAPAKKPVKAPPQSPVDRQIARHAQKVGNVKAAKK